ncbi:hypothetical protein [Actinomadura chokoriensis]|uniref:hypothetical protein n=1 Tax=Actinomadura chokoriensis TaxID=454156 RepID=UPI0031F8651A
MTDARPALWRGARTLGIALVGLAAVSAGYLWWGVANAALLAIVGCVGSAVALGMLYGSGRDLRFKGVALTLGFLALFTLYAVGVIAVRDVTMTMVGEDAEAIVAKTWTTGGTKGRPQHRCTLHRTDGTPLPREYASNCEGRERGDTLQIVLDPAGRFAPISGPKSDMSTTGELQVTAIAGLVLVLSIALGSPPKRK